MPAQPLVFSQIVLATLSSVDLSDPILFVHFLPNSWALQVGALDVACQDGGSADAGTFWHPVTSFAIRQFLPSMMLASTQP
jgi:hypothetical protein